MQIAKNPPVLARVPVSGGAAIPIPVPEGLRVTVNDMPAKAADAHGRLVFDVCSADSFFCGTALHDPARKSVARITGALRRLRFGVPSGPRLGVSPR